MTRAATNKNLTEARPEALPQAIAGTHQKNSGSLMLAAGVVDVKQ
jgi:hypothetical protein